MKNKGFTLIELLIVIALLGALAIGLLATIDPFEQLKKGRDTSQRNTLSEIYNSLLRYYSTRGKFPWDTSTGTANYHAQFLKDGESVFTDNNFTIDTLVQAGELKDKFQDVAGTANLDRMFMTTTSNTHVALCFEPESKSFQIDPNTVYNESGSAYTTASVDHKCKSLFQADPDAVSCDYCIQ
jgi:prepilin-type N-terminal cleavage/methylation domain-containing protein